MPENVKVARNNGRWLGRLEKFHSMRKKTRKYLRKKEIPNERKPLRIREKTKQNWRMPMVAGKRRYR